MALQIDTQALLEHLKQDRDELRLKLHLASMEIQDAWHEAEHHWDRLNIQLDKAAQEADDAADDIDQAAALLLAEIKHGYAKIKQALKH